MINEYSAIKSKLSVGIGPIDDQLGDCRIALVVKNGRDYRKVHQFMVSLRFEKTQVERKAFRDIDQAFSWLGFPENFESQFEV